MGITGLLPYLGPATKQCHISEFRGGTVAVDSYCLLHKGANACAEQLARGEDNRMYVDYCIKYVKMFLSYDIHPIMVFDGRNLPAKAETEAKRRESRKKAKQRAAELLKLGKNDEARTYLKQCIDITPKMAHNLIRECRKLNVDCIVAPYESDAQLAFFNVKGVAECIVTEDSDLILFGCSKVLFKLDLNGAGQLIESDKIFSAMKLRPDQFTFDKFRYMCILSGCDYVNSLSGIGLKKAEKFLKLTAETNPEIFLNRIPKYLNMKHLIVTEEYKKNVLIANATFLHQVVFDPFKKKLVHLNDPVVMGTNPDYLINAGDKFDNEKAFQVALGNLNPYNFEKYDSWVPLDVPQYSIWSGVYRKRISRKQEKLQKCRLNIVGVQKQSTVDEEVQVIEDSQIDKELLIYTKKSQVVVEMCDDCEEEIDKKKISPIVSKNPFLRKKKISKFPITFNYGNAIVKSRFFCSQSTSKVKTEMESTSRESAAENVPGRGNEESVLVDKNDVTFEQTVELNNDIGSLVSDTTLKSRENITEEPSKGTSSGKTPLGVSADEGSLISRTTLKSCENITEEVSNKRPSEKMILDNSIDRDHVGEHNSDESGQKMVTCSKETGEQETKKRKLGPCRSLGLRKKPPAQQTLHNFFGKFKKPE